MTQALREWVVENVALGVDRELIAQELTKRSVSPQAASEWIESVRSSPMVSTMSELVYRQQKLSSLLQLLKGFFAPPGDPSIDRITHADSVAFFSDYFFKLRPVVVTGLADDWPALSKWSPSYFREHFGNVEISVNADRGSDEAFEENHLDHRTRISIRDFVEWMEHNPDSNDMYVTSRDNLLLNEHLQELRDDFRYPQPFLTEDSPATPEGFNESLWFGAGSLTPLHHDDRSILLVQIYGEKRFDLISPFDFGLVYNDRYCFSSIDPLDSPELQQHLHSVVLGPGEALLIPVGYWHHVLSTSPSITLAFFNLPFDSLWRQSYYGDPDAPQSRYQPRPTPIPSADRPSFADGAKSAPIEP